VRGELNLHLPLAVDKTQIGYEDRDRTSRATAFRFFDWYSWTHIEGEIGWLGARTIDIKGKRVDLISGFVYTISDRHPPIEHIGLRLAGGVAGPARILLGREIKSMRFEPVNWMLIPNEDQHNVVAIVRHQKAPRSGACAHFRPINRALSPNAVLPRRRLSLNNILPVLIRLNVSSSRKRVPTLTSLNAPEVRVGS
jgi:hypothetical protein